MCSLFRSSVFRQPSFLSLHAGSRTVVGCFLSQVFQAVPALCLVAKQHPVKMAAKKATSSLFSPSTEEEAERESLTVSNTVQVLDFEDERYAATVTMSQQLEKIPLPKVQGAPQGTPECSKGESKLEQLAKGQGDAKEESCAKTSKVGSDAVASEVLRRGAGDQREACSAEALQGQDSCQALCQAGRARDVQCPGEGHGPQVCSLRATEALALGSFRMSSPSLRDRSGGAETCQLQSCGGLVEECNEGSSTIIIHGEKMMITTVSKTAEFGTSAAALAGTDKAFRYRIPEPPKVPARKRLPTPPRRPQGEAPMTPPRAPRTSTTPRTPGTASKAPSPVAAVEIESHASWQYQDLD